MNTNKAKRSSILPAGGLPNVYASYVINNQAGYVAVIDPDRDEIIHRISTGFTPSAMCMDPSEQYLYVVDGQTSFVNIYRMDDFKMASTFRAGTTNNSKPVAVFVDPSGEKAFVANYGERSVTVFDVAANNVIHNLEMPNAGRPFAFMGGHENSYVYVACKGDNGKDFVVAIDLGDRDNTPISLDHKEGITFDDTHNPLALHPNGHTLVSLGEVGMLDYIEYNIPGKVYGTTSLLDNTASGVYLDNGLLFCTMREDKNYLKVFKNLTIDYPGNITYEKFFEVPSYKGQDLIRTARYQEYVGITVQPTLYPTGGLHVIQVSTLEDVFTPLDVVGDLTFYSSGITNYDIKVYVAESNTLLSLGLGTDYQRRIQIGGNNVTVRNLISGYSNQSSSGLRSLAW